jgi:hypothetical protein
MKTEHEILVEFGLPSIPFDENVKMFYPAIIGAMKEYASQFRDRVKELESKLDESDGSLHSCIEDNKRLEVENKRLSEQINLAYEAGQNRLSF